MVISTFTLTALRVSLRPRLTAQRALSRTMSQVAVCQILSTNNPSHNLKIASRVIRGAAEAGAKACFLPEASDFIATSDEECRSLSAPLSKHHFTLGLQKVAKELGVVISVGVHNVPEEDEPNTEPEGSLRVYNTHVLIGKDGDIIGKYSKLHLYDVELHQPGVADVARHKRIGESDRIIPGDKVVDPVAVEGIGKIGLEICYDIRFPELQIILTRLGADILTFPSAFTPRTGKDHWATLNRAIAIQYQVYVLSAAQYGAHNPSRLSWGESIAFDPWGRELGRLRSLVDDSHGADKIYAEGGEFFLCEIDPQVIKDTRKQIPLAIQKRADIYGVVGKHELGK